VDSISLKRRQAALEFRLHHAIFRDFATGHGDDLEDCSGANCSKYRAVRSTDRETQSEPRSLLVSGKKPEGAAVVAANERLVRADATRDGLADVIAATHHKRQAAAA